MNILHGNYGCIVLAKLRNVEAVGVKQKLIVEQSSMAPQGLHFKIIHKVLPSVSYVLSSIKTLHGSFSPQFFTWVNYSDVPIHRIHPVENSTVRFQEKGLLSDLVLNWFIILSTSTFSNYQQNWKPNQRQIHHSKKKRNTNRPNLGDDTPVFKLTITPNPQISAHFFPPCPPVHNFYPSLILLRHNRQYII